MKIRSKDDRTNKDKSEEPTVRLSECFVGLHILQSFPSGLVKETGLWWLTHIK